MTISATKVGTLYIVATPIGNRDDITIRALKTLESVDKILAEDTRHSLQLLTLLGIKKPLVSLHEHNESEKCEFILSALQEGLSFALISDAGTPLISDPGYQLVKKARELNIPVTPVPGSCALIAALSAAGIPCEIFTFAGFLPAKTIARRHKLEELKKLEHTIIFYESTHRIKQSISDLGGIFGVESELILVKELTKAFERIIHGSCADILDWLEASPEHCKGEFVLLIPPRVNISPSKNDFILAILLKELPLKQAVKIAVELTGDHKNELYKKALELKNHENIPKKSS